MKITLLLAADPLRLHIFASPSCLGGLGNAVATVPGTTPPVGLAWPHRGGRGRGGGGKLLAGVGGGESKVLKYAL